MIQSSVVIIKRGEEFLLLKRSSDKEFGGEWCFPGGKTESAELPVESAFRECLEETGIQLDIMLDTRIYLSDGKYLIAVFLSTVDSNVEIGVQFPNPEHETYLWVTVEDAVKLEGIGRLTERVFTLALNDFL